MGQNFQLMCKNERYLGVCVDSEYCMIVPGVTTACYSQSVISYAGMRKFASS